MKVRQGFVSNSSSSSFIIAYKGDKPTKEIILKYLGIEENSPLKDFANQLSEFIINKINKERIILSSKEDIIKYQGCDEEDIEDWYGYHLKLINDGFNIVETSVSYNETDDPIENYLGNSYFYVESENLILKTEE